MSASASHRCATATPAAQLSCWGDGFPFVARLWRELFGELLRAIGSRWPSSQVRYFASYPASLPPQLPGTRAAGSVPPAGRTPFPRALPARSSRLATGGFAAGSVVLKTCLALVAIATLSLWPLPAAAQDGVHGHGHDQWHGEFYSKLLRPDTKTSCCNLSDCRPTEVRSVGDHYEVIKDGRWIRVPPEKIVKVAPPDGGAHICAPPTTSPAWGPDDVFCIVMPFET